MRSIALMLAGLLSLAAIVPAHAATAPAPLVVGTDYEVLTGAQPWQPLKKGEVEVAEVYAWWCPHCAHFAPTLATWAASQPAWVRVTYVPAAFSPDDSMALASFAAQRAGIFPRVHPMMFRAIHDDHTMPTRPSASEYAAFMASFGSTPEKLLTLMQSPEVKADMRHANAFMTATKIEGTPTLIVNGKYKVLGNSFEDELSILDRLIAQIHGGKL